MTFLPSADSAAGFERADRFTPASIPDPGPFLAGHDVLAGRDHVAFHRLTHRIFEIRGVQDVTFGYNLARLNLDARHPDAGFRYAVERPDGDADAEDADGVPAGGRVLRAEFTPTTEFCPQSDTLTTGAFRAWNGLDHLHEYDLVRVRVNPMHQSALEINAALADVEREWETNAADPATQ